MKRLVVVLLLILSSAVVANCQTFRGAINGTVTDPSGAVVPNAQVKATEIATSINHTTVTSSEGQFALQDIPLGFYKVSVTAQGFPTYAVDKVEVIAGTIHTLSVQLRMAQAQSTVEVSGAAITLDTTSVTQSTDLTSDVVNDLPMNGRDFTQFVAVSPGYGGYQGNGFGSVNGTRPNQINWQIDGVDNNDFWHNVPAVNQGGVSGVAGVILPLDSVVEFSAQTESGPEGGRNAGGTVNVVTKSGGNDLHGSIYYYNRNEFYSDPSPFLPAGAKSPRLRNENYGASIGGPIRKDKLFYFFNYEKQEFIIGLSGLATEPSAAWVANAGALLAANSVPVSLASCNALAALTSQLPAGQIPSGCNQGNRGFWPTSGPGSVAGLPATLRNFFSSVAESGYSYNAVGRVDYQISNKHHLYLRVFGGQGNQTAPLGGSPALGTASSNLAYYFEVAPIHVDNYSAVLNSTITSRLTNQVLFGANYFNQIFHDNNNSFNTKNMGIFLSPDAVNKGQYILGAPNIVIGPPNSGGIFEQIGLTPPEGRSDLTWHITDIVSQNTGAHQLRYGAEVRRATLNEFYHRRGTGFFTFDGTQGPWAGSPTCVGAAANPALCSLADFLAGFVAGGPKDIPGVVGSSIAVGNPERFVDVNAFNAYIQDSWQFTKKLNLSFGLRYEYFGPLHDDKKDIANFVPGRGFLIQDGHPLFEPGKDHFAPRVGFAYRLGSKGDLVVRGGFGVFYDQINLNPFLDFRPPVSAAQGIEGNPFGTLPVSTYTRSAYQWDAVQAGGNSIFPGVKACAPSPGDCTGPGDPQGLGIYSVSPNFRTPYFFSYDLQVEKSFGNAGVWQIGYVGNEGRKLNIVSDINQNKAFRQFSHILQLNTIGTSNYNALQTTFRTRTWHGLTTQFAYTWAHALDEISEYRHIILDDAFNKRRDYGNSDFNTPQLFTASIDYTLPKFSFATGWSKWLINDWTFSSLINVHSGQPSDETLLGLDLVGDPFKGVSHKFSQANGGTQWWNPAAFAVPTGGPTCPLTRTGFCGDIARNRFPGPGYASVDLSTYKDFPFTERVKLRLGVQVFNLFNRINLSQSVGALGGNCGTKVPGAVCTTKAGFGLASDTAGDFVGAPGIGAGEARNAQLLARISF